MPRVRRRVQVALLERVVMVSVYRQPAPRDDEEEGAHTPEPIEWVTVMMWTVAALVVLALSL